MLKAYQYCLSTVLIIDTNKNTMFSTPIYNINSKDAEQKAREQSKKITKATIQKHINNYGEFVIGIPILNEYAPEYVHKYDKQKDFIGSFENWDNMQEFFNTLDEKCKPFFEKYKSCNDWAEILEYFIKVNRGLSDWDKNHYRKAIADKNNSFHADAVRAKMLMDLLTDTDILEQTAAQIVA